MIIAEGVGDAVRLRETLRTGVGSRRHSDDLNVVAAHLSVAALSRARQKARADQANADVLQWRHERPFPLDEKLVTNQCRPKRRRPIIRKANAPPTLSTLQIDATLPRLKIERMLPALPIDRMLP